MYNYWAFLLRLFNIFNLCIILPRLKACYAGGCEKKKKKGKIFMNLINICQNILQTTGNYVLTNKEYI